MELIDYFQNIEGTGILATANSEGKVDIAIYARPHCFDGDLLGFIMRARRNHRNLHSNPHAAYMFIEKAAGYQGKRLYLQKVREEKNSATIKAIEKKPGKGDADSIDEDRYLVYFRVEDIRPLTGDKL